MPYAPSTAHAPYAPYAPNTANAPPAPPAHGRLPRARLLVGLLLAGAAATPVLAQRTVTPAAVQAPGQHHNPLPTSVLDALARAQVPASALAAVVLRLGPMGPLGSIGSIGSIGSLGPIGPTGPIGAAPRSGPKWQTWQPPAPFQWQADLPMQPASTMKLLTSIVALDQLGPNHRGFTELLTQAPQLGDVLAGDLVLRGGADAELGLPQLWAMLAELRWQGIREINGDIVLDRHLFRPALPDPLAPAFDAWPEFAYNVAPDALQFNHNLLDLELRSDDPSRPGSVSARAWPPLPGVEIDASALRLTDKPCGNWAEDWASPAPLDGAASGPLRIRLQGGFPNACSQRTGLVLMPRNTLVERHLRWVWQGLGGQWHGQVRDASSALIAPVPTDMAAAAVASLGATAPAVAWLAPGVAWAASSNSASTSTGSPAAADPRSALTPPGTRLLARHLARPWGELLRLTNKQSDNPNSRLLFLSLGLAAMADQPSASTAALAEQAVHRWLADQQIDAPGLVLDNGSGLSRTERISPRTLALMLQAAHRGRWAPELLMSLPLAGVDGSMRKRFETGPASARARLKGGTLSNVTAVAGYVPDAQGRWWALAAMLNHPQAGAARPALDALVDWVAGTGLAHAANASPSGRAKAGHRHRPPVDVVQ